METPLQLAYISPIGFVEQFAKLIERELALLALRPYRVAWWHVSSRAAFLGSLASRSWASMAVWMSFAATTRSTP